MEMDAVELAGNRDRMAWDIVERHPKARFVMELEFVEMLANPRYLQYLAQNKYFEDPRFIRYLDYLNYWRLPQYVQYITHPHCLYFLELLQTPEFRAKLMDPMYVEMIHDNQYWHWKFFRTNRAQDAQ